jgi:hypothetical protein
MWLLTRTTRWTHMSNYKGCNWKVQTNFEHEFQIPKQEKMSISTCVQKHLTCELLPKEYTPRHVPSWAAASVQRCWDRCGWPDRHPKWDGEMPLHCQKELHTQGVFGVPIGKNRDNSNLARVEVMQWVLVYLSIGHDRCYWVHISTARLKYAAAPPCIAQHSFTVTHILNVSGHMLIWAVFLVLVCGTSARSLSAPFGHTLYIHYTSYLYIHYTSYWIRIEEETSPHYNASLSFKRSSDMR